MQAAGLLADVAPVRILRPLRRIPNPPAMKLPFGGGGGGSAADAQAAPAGYDPEGGPPAEVKVGTAETSVRLGFLRKVYTILTLNFLITVGFACFCSFVLPVRRWIFNNSWLQWVGLVVVIAAMIGLACCRIPPPFNIGLLALFVAGFSLLIGTICAIYFEVGWGGVVLQAFLATAAIFIAITTYIMITKKDFSYLGSFLFGALIALIVVSLCTFVFRLVVGRVNKWVGFAISVFGALLMVGYLLYDTSLVVTRYGPDDWLIAVISLYTDVMNLFLFLLNIFSVVNA